MHRAQCDHRAAAMAQPDVIRRFESEITTYVTMVRPMLGIRDFGSTGDLVKTAALSGEEKSDRESMESAIEKCKAAEEVARFLAKLLDLGPRAHRPMNLQVGDLLELYCKACEEGDVIRQDWFQPKFHLNELQIRTCPFLRCMHYIAEIRELEIELIDAATAHLSPPHLLQECCESTQHVFCHTACSCEPLSSLWLARDRFEAAMASIVKFPISSNRSKLVLVSSLLCFPSVRCSEMERAMPF